jgi:hypothetical protein
MHGIERLGNCERLFPRIFSRTDPRLRTPPSINTLTRIHKLCTRARLIQAGRAVPATTLNMETAHALPAPKEFLVCPTPYFKVRNQWLKPPRADCSER